VDLPACTELVACRNTVNPTTLALKMNNANVTLFIKRFMLES
jgi:hypothetical protein